MRLSQLVDRLRRSLALNRPRLLVAVLSIVVSFYVVAFPFWGVRYPPLTDLPFHAAQISIFRHYFDPAWHFREQFTLHLFEAPYWSMYALGALFSFFMPVWAATKLTAVVMLALLPIGLAALFGALKKNELLGLLGLCLVWSSLTHWGFLSYLGALGLYALALAAAIRLLDQPTRARALVLMGWLILIFATHVYRFAFTVVAVAIAGVVMYPVTRRLRPLLVPVGSSLALLVLWLLLRPRALAGEVSLSAPRWGRFGELPKHLYQSYFANTAEGVREQRAAITMLVVVVLIAVLSFAYRVRAPNPDRDRRLPSWERHTTALVLVLASMHVLAYLVLPESIGEWWYVYPREALAAIFIALAAMPDLPRKLPLELAFVAAIGFSSGRMARLVRGEWQKFEVLNADFSAIAELIPRSPKLLYLIFDHTDTSKMRSPFIHFPAWIQAEKGGFLNFHFAGWGLYPARYRSDGSSVPPPFPKHFEWTPQYFRVLEHGAWFDTFLIRHRIDPGVLIKPDPSVHFVARRGKWWLYRRDPGPREAPNR